MAAQDQINVTRGGACAGLEALVRRAAGRDRGLPPVEKWNPPYCGDLDIRIAADGLWFYLGTPIGREALVRLFASVLRRDEDGRHYLVTPVEKIGITVDDVPFVAVEMFAAGEGPAQVITLRTNVGDIVEVGPAHPLRFTAEPETDGVRPYVLVRGRLEARLARPLLFELVETATIETRESEDWFGVWSNETFFPMMRAAELRQLSRP